VAVATAVAAAGLIWPDWPAPAAVRAVATTRAGGISRGRYASLNLGDHVGDDEGDVAQNRALLRTGLGLAAEPAWLVQVHGREVAVLDGPPTSTLTADAALTTVPGLACVVMVADCLPVLLCDRAGQRVAAVHAGWRGLASGVIEATLAALADAGSPPGSLLAWLGPAIGTEHYEVGADVRRALLDGDPDAGEALRSAARQGHWWLDLYAAARRRLIRAGVADIWGGEFDTYADPARFFSYRRDKSCGRQAALIWLDPARSPGAGG
jgi:hypothetical protein